MNPFNNPEMSDFLIDKIRCQINPMKIGDYIKANLLDKSFESFRMTLSKVAQKDKKKFKTKTFGGDLYILRLEYLNKHK
tara:strand:+ start:673 stop:909 length:237 start_codon:yes stop_codon:yes gene_type:complete